MKPENIRAAFEARSIEPGIVCIAPHENDEGVGIAEEILADSKDDLVVDGGDDLVVITVERYTTAHYKDWWAEQVKMPQIVEHGSLVLGAAGIKGEVVDPDWFRRFESDGGVILE